MSVIAQDVKAQDVKAEVVKAHVVAEVMAEVVADNCRLYADQHTSAPRDHGP